MTSPCVLVVDDDDLNVEVMQAYLKRESYDVQVAYSGESALQRVAASPPDLILLDARMSGISGYETCKKLKADPKTQHIPVLMITGLSDNHDIQKAVEAGVDDILFKPIKPVLMLLRVRRLLYQKQLYDQLHP